MSSLKINLHVPVPIVGSNLRDGMRTTTNPCPRRNERRVSRHLTCRASPLEKPTLPAFKWGRQRSPLKSPRDPRREDEDEDESNSASSSSSSSQPGWGLLDLSQLSYRWSVPWGGWTTAGGMVLWLVSFAGVGFAVVPGAYRALGIDIFNLSPEDKATFTLVCQLAETAVSLSLIRLLTVKAMDEAPDGSTHDLFVYSLKDPFTSPRGWAVWAAIGVVLSPLVVGAVAGALSFTGYEAAVGGRGTVDGVADMIRMDLPTYLSLLSVTGALAPLLEETVFRGFLLTSLTKWMPSWAAVPTASLFFGLAHLSPRDFPVLFSLGCLLGWVYVRSRNLITPIMVHGVWNSTVLSLLFYIASTGVDIEELIGQIP